MIGKKSKIFIAGRFGMVGSALERGFRDKKYTNIIGERAKDLDLRNQESVKRYFQIEKPDFVVLAAAKVGGLVANINAPAEFIYDNLMIQNNVIHYSYIYGVRKLLFLASSNIYPRVTAQPIKEEYLFEGKLESTNEGYSLAKLVGLKMCELYNKQYGTDFFSVVPCNLYGINDNFDPIRSHVIPAMIRKFHKAKRDGSEFVEIWGTGNARREFLFSEDFAEACIYLFENYTGSGFVNIGTGQDYSIKDLAEYVKRVVDYKGKIFFNPSKPEGIYQKVMDVSRLKRLGWQYKTTLGVGLEKTYQWYLRKIKEI